MYYCTVCCDGFISKELKFLIKRQFELKILILYIFSGMIILKEIARLILFEFEFDTSEALFKSDVYIFFRNFTIVIVV